MKKKLVIVALSFILVFSLFIGFSSIKLESAVCYSDTGDKCEGECCIANPFWCKAGPCSKILGNL